VPLNALNYLNLLAYLLNAGVTYAVGQFGETDIGDQSDLYQSILTPSGWAFSIWGIIFISQLIFAIVQFLPSFRSLPMVQDGVGYWYIAACIFQIAWTPLFTYDIIWASLVAMLLILGSLVGLLTSQYFTNDTSSKRRMLEFWVLKFPFAIHCGWICAATALNVNVVVVFYGASIPTQLTVGILSLAVLHAVALFVLYVPNKPNYTIPLVLAWANGAIASELSTPEDSISNRFSEDIILGVKNAAASVSVIILTLVFVRLMISCYIYCSMRKSPQEGKSLEPIHEGVVMAVIP
jgi:benzodiazapine receptor